MGNHDQTGSCSALPAFEIILSNTDYVYVCGTTMVAYWLLFHISLAGTTIYGSLLPGRVAVAN